MNILKKTMIMMIAFGALGVTQIDAYCARCAKIEAERAKEQALHPQTVGYYGDQLSLKTVENVQNDPSEVTRSKKKSLESPYPTGEQDIAEETDVNKGSVESTTLSPQAYSTIYTIFKTKNFLETLDGSFTLFIPTNEALRKLSPEMLIDLTQPESQEKLAALVSNHLVAHKLLRKDFINKNNAEVKAISGKNLTLSFENGRLFIDGTQILRAEPAGYDGVIYIIDKVLTP